MYIEELKKNIHPDAYEKFEQNINKQLKATWLDNIFKIWNCYLNSFELFHKETNQKYNIWNTMMFNNYKINLKKASNKIEENNEKATIFVNFPFRFSQIADRWISFEADLVLWEQIYFDNIKIFHKKKLVCSLEWKSFSLYKETSKKIHSKRATKVVFCFQVLEKKFLFTKLDEDTYNVYWFKKDFIGKGREFKYKKQQIKYSKLTNLNNEWIGFIDNDWKHKFFSTCWDIIDVSDFANNSISNLTSLSMNKFYSITLKNEKNIYFKNKDNTLSPLKNKTNLQEWANLLKNPMQKISDNLFFKIYTWWERGDVKNKSTSLFSKNLIFLK